MIRSNTGKISNQANAATNREEFVWAIVFDQECFGLFWTEEGARASLEEQIAEGGPAWGDCKVEKRHVND